MASSEPENDLSRPPNTIEQFRTRNRRLKIHPAELRVLWIVAANLVFLSWALGGMRPWAQWISFGLAAFGFLLSLLPRDYTEEYTGRSNFRMFMWPKLTRFPIFWLGLALLGVVTIQGLNPSWTYQTDGKSWWMAAVPHAEWLPTGVTAPFAKWNPWRMLVIYSSALMTVCSIWVAFTRRRTIQLFLTVLALNGLLIALFGIAQRLLGNGKMFWFFRAPAEYFFAGFVYKNHAGEYLNIILAVTCGLAGWYYLRGLRRMEKSNPSGVFAFFATCIAVAIVTSYARGSTLLMLAFLTVCIAAFVIHQLFGPSEHRKPVVAIVLILVFGFFLKTGFDALRAGQAWTRIEQGINRKDWSLESREIATRASLEMLGDTWKTGVGAGSFRHIFPVYQRRYPEITQHAGGPIMVWEHAHNDIVQLPIELGATGIALLLLGFLYYAVTLVRSYFWENPLSVCIVFGLLVLMVHAWWDFPFQCPAILITACALWPVAALWAKMEESGSR